MTVRVALETDRDCLITIDRYELRLTVAGLLSNIGRSQKAAPYDWQSGSSSQGGHLDFLVVPSRA
jgi:hypothetical protein